MLIYKLITNYFATYKIAYKRNATGCIIKPELAIKVRKLDKEVNFAFIASYYANSNESNK